MCRIEMIYKYNKLTNLIIYFIIIYLLFILKQCFSTIYLMLSIKIYNSVVV